MNKEFLEEDYITFETAKLAKELGFDNGSNRAYIAYKSTFIYDDDENHPESYKAGEIRKLQEYNKNSNNSSEYYEIFEMPTQALLYKWLRQEYEIEIEIEKTTVNNTISLYREDKLLAIRCIGLFPNGDNYTEAMEEGLKSSLIHILQK
jgi:hypothetical protein